MLMINIHYRGGSEADDADGASTKLDEEGHPITNPTVNLLVTPLM